MTVPVPDVRALLRQALEDVVGVTGGSHLRGDSPLLASVGSGVLAPADACVLADAVEQLAAESGVRCVLTDEDFLLAGATLTLSELQTRIEHRLAASLGERA